MKIWKQSVLYYLGGASYMTLEFLYRGRSHGSMFLLGGLCFSLLGQIKKLRRSLPLRATLGAGAITGLEFLTGLLVNQEYQVWDYRRMPLNLQGQVCLPFTLLWIPLSLAGFFLYDRADRALTFPPSAVK